MPYIPEDERHELDAGLEAVIFGDLSVGDLNYLVTRLIAVHCGERGWTYGSINDAIGVLECAKLELYRRVAAPYEDLKIKENGDVDEYQELPF